MLVTILWSLNYCLNLVTSIETKTWLHVKVIKFYWVFLCEIQGLTWVLLQDRYPDVINQIVPFATSICYDLNKINNMWRVVSTKCGAMLLHKLWKMVSAKCETRQNYLLSYHNILVEFFRVYMYDS